MAWGHSGKCKSCIQPNKATDRKKTAKPVEVPAAAPQEGEEEEDRPDFYLADAISGLNAFLAARRRRLGTRPALPVASLSPAGSRRRPAQARPAAPRPQKKAA